MLTTYVKGGVSMINILIITGIALIGLLPSFLIGLGSVLLSSITYWVFCAFLINEAVSQYNLKK